MAAMIPRLRRALRVLPLLLVLALAGSADPLRVRFVDIGQGDSILVRTPSGKGWLVDGGPRRAEATAGIMEGMEALGLDRLEGIVLSHPHLDHFGGLLRLVETVEVGQVLYGIDIQATTYDRFKQLLAARGIPYRHVPEGAMAWDPELDVEVLHSRGQARLDQAIFSIMGTMEVAQAELGELLTRGCGQGATVFGIDLNDYSVVLRVRLGAFRLLLTGDATETVEQRLVEGGESLEAEVLKVAHHGSRYSSGLEFLEHTGLDQAVIQVATGNSFGHPHREAVRRLQGQGAPIARNDLSGDLDLVAWPDGSFEITPERP